MNFPISKAIQSLGIFCGKSRLNWLKSISLNKRIYRVLFNGFAYYLLILDGKSSELVFVYISISIRYIMNSSFCLIKSIKYEWNVRQNSSNIDSHCMERNTWRVCECVELYNKTCKILRHDTATQRLSVATTNSHFVAISSDKYLDRKSMFSSSFSADH